MSSSAEYRELAEECFRLAEQAKNEHQQASFKKLAEAWLKLAEASDQKGRQVDQAKGASRDRRTG